MDPALGWAARDASGVLSPFSFSRRSGGEDDVTIKILYCGICHTDLHIIKNDWGNAAYPVVPGHEIVGIVTGVGSNVDKFKVGEKVGVGYMVDSCLSCDSCEQDYENYCDKVVNTSNGIFSDGTKTYGGFSDAIVVKERKHLGVVGLGGLGHLAVKFGKAFGMKVTVISGSPSKEKEAIEHLGADSFLVSRNPEQMQAARSTMDGIIDTVSAFHPILPLISLLKVHGKMIMLGGPNKPLELYSYSLIQGGKMVAGSCIGGMKDTQEMIEFAGKHNITAEAEVVGMEYVNTAMDRLAAGDVRYRFVIDVANTLVAT
uniref:cinnamyl-alcohol dehydrogenase n=1 Tax=Ananas comosus var. bracteatus TaxID=296719 RepID=A0A6V7P7B0_ANACO|nr:unnamed protein product [Ananas comosus var. bracteatus]